MDDIERVFEAASSLLARLARLDLTTMDDEAICSIVARAERAGRLIDTIRAVSAAEVEERSRFELGAGGLSFRNGHRRGTALVEHITRVSQGEAARRIRLGMAIRARRSLAGETLPAAYPRVAEAMIAGQLGTDAAGQIVRCLGQAEKHTVMLDRLAVAEEALVEAATHDCADLVGIQAGIWREALDPDGAEVRDDEVRQRRGFRLGRERHGLTPFSGEADPTFAALLRSAFAEANAPDAKPRFLGEEDTARGTETVTTPDGRVVEVLKDPRTREQRQLDVLVGLVTAGVRATGTEPGGMRSTATVMAVVQLKDLQSGTGAGWLDDVDEPISGRSVRELACDAELQTVILGDNGKVVHLGIGRRYFTTPQRRALAVRDGGCVWPQCTAPPSWCHAHHVEEWQHGGRTSIDNGLLLCPAHHHMLHNSDFQFRMIGGKPRLLAPPWIDPDQTWRPVGRTRAMMTETLPV